MKKMRFLSFLCAGALAIGAGAGCSEDKMDEVDTNPNSPTEVALRLVLPQTEVTTAFSISGTDLAWYSSIFVEHTTGVHAQFQQADNREGGSFNASVTGNNWTDNYHQLRDLDYIIARGSTGAESGSWHYVGIAQILKAYTLGVTTDLFGRIPNRQAGLGEANLRPAFDLQRDVYADINKLLDDAIANLDKTTSNDPGDNDLFFGGDADQWKKTAYSLKARFAIHLSNVDAAWADKVLAAVPNGFSSSADDFTFAAFNSNATGQNPWYQESTDRSHFAVSKTFFDLLTGLNDPRLEYLVGEVSPGVRNPAPNGESENDQGGNIYSRASSDVVGPASPLPIMTYAELKFIEAEAKLNKGDRAGAYSAYLDGVNTSLSQQGVSGTPASNYVAQPSVGVGSGALTRKDIITQKYISFWIYQPLEAYNDYRRVDADFPTLTNTKGAPPKRFPYPQAEFDSNASNVPNVDINANGVWWDDNSDD
jgi:Starch-binding associating with outer membrane